MLKILKIWKKFDENPNNLSYNIVIDSLHNGFIKKLKYSTSGTPGWHNPNLANKKND